MSLSDHAADQAKFFAREIVARFEHDTGGELSAVVRDRMLFAAEMGYLRGHGDGMRALDDLHDDLRKKVIDGE